MPLLLTIVQLLFPLLQVKSLSDRFSFSPTKSQTSSSESAEAKSPPAKAVKKTSVEKNDTTKKRKRVIEEDDDDFVPGEAADGDYEVVGADSDDDESLLAAMDEDAEEEEFEDRRSKPKTARKKFKTKEFDSDEEKEQMDLEEAKVDRKETKLKKSVAGITIDEKLEAAQSDFDRQKMNDFSERVVAAVERARERMERRGSEYAGDSDEGEEGEEGEEEEGKGNNRRNSGANSAKNAKSGGAKNRQNSKSSASSIKYTPLELQYLEMREKHPETILFVESGYRYKFFGKDAEIASKVLNIRAGISNNFLSTSVPVHRLHVHAMRLVQAGYKVGVVSQIETAALKAISSNKSGPFKRAVSALYTKSTLVNENMDPLTDSSTAYGNYLFALYETSSHTKQMVDSIRIHIVAVKTSTGDIIYDSFDDSGMRNELETRLRHINPVEIVLPRNVSSSTKRLIEHLCSSKLKEDLIRLEYLEPNCFDLKVSRELIDDELANYESSLKIDPRETELRDDNSTNAMDEEEKGSEISNLKGSQRGSGNASKSLIKKYRGQEGRDMLNRARSFFSSLDTPQFIVFGALTHYLKEFGLSSLICLSCNFNSFSSAKHMYLDGNALSNLELLTNQQTNTKDGSLLAVIDQTSTSFGKRRLMQWIRQPLATKIDIDERLDAVEEISKLGASDADPATYEGAKQDSSEPKSSQSTNSKNSDSSSIYVANKNRNGLTHLLALLPQLPDLERGICRIFYNRCSVQEFLSVLASFRHVAIRMPKIDEIEACCQSSLLKKLLRKIPHDFADHVSYFLDPLNINSTDSQKCDLFVNTSFHPALQEVTEQLKFVESELDDHLLEIREKLGKPRLEYVKKNKDEYVIELTKAEASRAPKNWISLASPQSCSRFHTPFIVEKYKELLQFRERVAMETANAWAQFVAEFASRYAIFRDTVDALATLDVLQCFSKLAKTEGFVRPTIIGPKEGENEETKNQKTENLDSDASEGLEISIKNGRHPIVESLLLGTSKAFVPNDTEMGGNLESRSEKVTIITGPNMGGKTCYTRQVALLCIMAQMGSYVPAERMKLFPLDLIATRMGAYDNMAKGQSTFFVELQETSDILRTATPRSLVILDELGRGTSTHDGFSIAFATLHHLITINRCFTLFVTHYPALSQLTRLFPKIVSNHHISYLEEEGSSTAENTDNNDSSSNENAIAGPRITFLHKLVRGTEGRSFGMNVARLALLPESVVSSAAKRSSSLESQVKSRYAKLAIKKLYELAQKGKQTTISDLQALLQLVGTHS